MHPNAPQASTKSLLKATAVAAAVAAVITLCAILPAEYGIDPTGFGQFSGLSAIAQAESAGDNSASNDLNASVAMAPALSANAVTNAATSANNPTSTPTATTANLLTSAVSQQADVAKSATLTLTLAPNKGAELKAKMQQGQSFVFSWSANGQPLSVDMHGEEPDAKADEYTSYWLEPQQSAGNGLFIAPFSGSHGWYWKNKGTEPVTVTVTIHGFFAEFYRP